MFTNFIDFSNEFDETAKGTRRMPGGRRQIQGRNIFTAVPPKEIAKPKPVQMQNLAVKKTQKRSNSPFGHQFGFPVMDSPKYAAWERKRGQYYEPNNAQRYPETPVNPAEKVDLVSANQSQVSGLE